MKFAKKILLTSLLFSGAVQASNLELEPQKASVAGSYGQYQKTSVAYTFFGEQLFNGGFSGNRSDAMSADYLISTGDIVDINMWGAFTFNKAIPVDSNGNLFIPGIGPLLVKGFKQSELNQIVLKAVKKVYPRDVNVYTRIQGVQPVSIYVTGFVENPGHYAGTPEHSILYYLSQAQGVSKELGSYRSVDVLRNGKVVKTYDLYDFLVSGSVESFAFKDGDTIHVNKRNGVFTVERAGHKVNFELTSGSVLGTDVLGMVKEGASLSHVLIDSIQSGQQVSRFLTKEEFVGSVVMNGDSVKLISDVKTDSLVVELEGEFLGDSHYIVKKGTDLESLLDVIPVNKDFVALNAISVKRPSLAKKQKEVIEEELRRLESSYLVASSSTSEEAQIRSEEAKLISQFVAKASEVEPDGRLVVYADSELNNIQLKDGDVIVIPEKKDSVIVSGQVMMPLTIVFDGDYSVSDYLAKAGGVTEQADEEKVLVIRQSGEVVTGLAETVYAGDQIVVLPKAPVKNIQLATSISQIVYQVAVAAKVALDL